MALILLPSNKGNKVDWIICFLEIIAFFICIGLTAFLMERLLDKYLFPSQIEYENECLISKSGHDKRPILSPWCLLLLRHRMPFNDTNLNRRDKRHMLPRFDLDHVKLQEDPATVQRTKFRDRNSPPVWTEMSQSRPLFQAVDTKALPFPNVEVTHTPSSIKSPGSNAATAQIFDHSHMTVQQVSNFSALVHVNVQKESTSTMPSTLGTLDTSTITQTVVPVTQESTTLPTTQAILSLPLPVPVLVEQMPQQSEPPLEHVQPGSVVSVSNNETNFTP